MKGIAVTTTKVKFDVSGTIQRVREWLFGPKRLDITVSDPIVETAAQMLHSIRHRAGTAHTCGQCRSYAEAVHFIYKNEILVVGPDAIQGWMAAREYYGTSDDDGANHGAECDQVVSRHNKCTCNRAKQEAIATNWMMDYKRPDLRDTWVGKLPRR